MDTFFSRVTGFELTEWFLSNGQSWTSGQGIDGGQGGGAVIGLVSEVGLCD